MCKHRIRTLAVGGEPSGVKRRGPSGHGRGKGARARVTPVNRVTSHVLVRRLVPGYLNQLYRAQHGDPDQLNTNPQDKNEGKGIA